MIALKGKQHAQSHVQTRPIPAPPLSHSADIVKHPLICKCCRLFDVLVVKWSCLAGVMFVISYCWTFWACINFESDSMLIKGASLSLVPKMFWGTSLISLAFCVRMKLTPVTRVAFTWRVWTLALCCFLDLLADNLLVRSLLFFYSFFFFTVMWRVSLLPEDTPKLLQSGQV